MGRQIELLRLRIPSWNPFAGSVDYYYWLWGTGALHQWGGPYWTEWKAAVEQALVPNQRRDGNFAGSWDPVGPWGQDGGRIYATAAAALALEAYLGEHRLLTDE